MGFPKIKHALLCRILVYVIVIGGFFLPVVVAFRIDFLSDTLKSIILLVALAGLLVYMWKNFVVLMTMDCMFALMHCYHAARKFFVLRDSFSVEKAEKRLSRFGRTCDIGSITPCPKFLRYKKGSSMTIYANGIEKILAVYHTDRLDKKEYQSIIMSANTNVRILAEKNKPPQKDRSGKKHSLHRVTVIVIFAKTVDEAFEGKLWDILDKNSGDGFDISVLPCIVNLDSRRCTFDSMRIPYYGIQYPVKNRGIRMIRRYLFGGSFPYAASLEQLDPIDVNEDESLWRFWKNMMREEKIESKRFKKVFEKMDHREILFDGDYLYLKWNEYGIWQAVEILEEQKIAEVDAVDMWFYPKTNKIAKATVKEINDLIRSYFGERGYSVRYVGLGK